MDKIVAVTFKAEYGIIKLYNLLHNYNLLIYKNCMYKCASGSVSYTHLDVYKRQEYYYIIVHSRKNNKLA